MAEEHKQRRTPLVIDSGGGPIEFLAAQTAEARVPIEIVIAVEGIPELISAVRAGSTQISYYKPAVSRWFPPWFIWKILYLIVKCTMIYLVVHDGMSHGYTIEFTQRGSKPSITLRPSHPGAGDPVCPPAP